MRYWVQAVYSISRSYFKGFFYEISCFDLWYIEFKLLNYSLFQKVKLSLGYWDMVNLII